MTINENCHISPFEIRKQKFTEFITFFNRYSDYLYRKDLEFKRTHKKVKNKDGTYRWIEKKYADDNMSFI